MNPPTALCNFSRMSRNLKYGVLRLTGQDQRGALEHAVRFLACGSTARQRRLTPASIDTVWVRGFGRFGGVLLRFSATPATFDHLSNQRSWARVEREIAADNPDRHQRMRLSVFEAAAEQQQFVANRAHTVCHLKTGPQPDTKRASGSARFRRFVYYLASGAAVDLSQLDHIRTVDYSIDGAERVAVIRTKTGLRLFAPLPFGIEDDTGVQREISLSADLDSLRKRTRAARDLAFGAEPPDMEFLQRETDFEEYVTMALAAAVQPKDQRHTYVYVQMHCADQPGLFACVLDCLETCAWKYSELPVEHRAVSRACCRGLGGRAGLLFAVRGDESLARVIRAELNRTLLASGLSIRTGGERWSDILDVQCSSEPPGVVDRKDSDTRLMVSFRAGHDHPGAIHHLCRRIGAASNTQASIFYFDAREKPTADNRPTRKFGVAIGLVVPREVLKETRAALEDAIVSVEGFHADRKSLDWDSSSRTAARDR